MKKSWFVVVGLLANCTFVLPSHAQVQGYLDAANCDGISGWARDTSSSTVFVSISINTISPTVAQLVAQQFRPDVAAAGFGSGNSGFSQPASSLIPRDGQTYTVDAVVNGVRLGNSPRTVTCGTAVGTQGYLDVLNCDTIAGWAWNASQPNTGLEVVIASTGTPASPILSNAFRPDLLAAGKGNGNHAFNIPTPAYFKDGAPHAVVGLIEGGPQSLINVSGTQQITCN